MPKTMLIDAYHREETRVAVTQGGKVEDFDFEYASRKPLRGNIYLARVTRVEPSLQAAFVEYGGNRHGFLAFGEIHPDYYQIPVADREVLRKAEALEVELAKKLAERDQDSDDDVDVDDEVGLRQSSVRDDDGEDADVAASSEHQDDTAAEDDSDDVRSDQEAAQGLIETLGQGPVSSPESLTDGGDQDAVQADTEASDDSDAHDDEPKGTIGLDHEDDEKVVSDDVLLDSESATSEADAPTGHEGSQRRDADDESAGDDPSVQEPSAQAASDTAPEEVSEDQDAGMAGDSASDRDESHVEDEDGNATDERGNAQKTNPEDEELTALRAEYENAKRERNRLLRAYKIQEVIKRRQIMLVQVVKEERGNKGAALTTYLSLAGRYGVLMPNTARGGGISRKITSQSDRRRLKKAMADLDIASNMGLIIRTAGAKRTKIEIKRDYDYLARLWETIREKTMESVAPQLIYEEASLIKRAIRDLYDKDTNEILVQGEEGYREAKDFMKMLMPSHAKAVQRYKGEIPIFLKQKVEQQLDDMYKPVVQLKSGGYLVIQQTEALVSIDVNSGKATKERNVEATALKTNSEAAVEVARQCRLRDLAGLVVIDFIDMEENRNNRTVEKKLKEAMKHDRARTQIGNISGFGLMELSRQRRRSGIVDGTTQVCPVCEGAGHVRSHEMAALRILRASEGVAAQGKSGLVTVKTSTDVALYILNTKRAWLERMEATYGVKTNILADSSRFGEQYDVSGSGSPSEVVTLRDTVGDDGPLTDLDAPELEADEADQASSSSSDNETQGSEDKPKRRRRRRRRRGGEDRQDEAEVEARSTEDEASYATSGESDDEQESQASDDTDDDGEPRRKRRRGRRGGRRNRRSGQDKDTNAEAQGEAADGTSDQEPENQAEPAEGQDSETQEIAASVEHDNGADEAPLTNGANASADNEPSALTAVMEKNAPNNDKGAVTEETLNEPAPAPEPVMPSAPAAAQEAKPRRSGWWQRAFQKT
ncbi:MAG: Rne/Rng family ribonuclease [Pseudomonadota bacterium]